MTSTAINFALFTQAMKYINEGDLRRARALGFSNEELQVIGGFSMQDINTLIHEFPNMARFEVDHSAFETGIRRMARNQSSDAQINRCIRLGGSVEMLGYFFGLTPNDIASRRTLMGLKSVQGRPPMPDEQTDHKAWSRWKEVCDDPFSPTASDDLDAVITLAEETGLLLSVVWNLVKQWTDPVQPPQTHPPHQITQTQVGKSEGRRGVA